MASGTRGRMARAARRPDATTAGRTSLRTRPRTRRRATPRRRRRPDRSSSGRSTTRPRRCPPVPPPPSLTPTPPTGRRGLLGTPVPVAPAACDRRHPQWVGCSGAPSLLNARCLYQTRAIWITRPVGAPRCATSFGLSASRSARQLAVADFGIPRSARRAAPVAPPVFPRPPSPRAAAW